MRILDEKNKELSLESIDFSKGYLSNETIVLAHHEAVEERQGKSHIEVIQEYPNGGKDILTIWDEEPVKAQDAYDETEEIQRFHTYTDEKLKQREEERKESEEREKKLESLYNSSVPFSDIVTEKEQLKSFITDIQVALADLYEQMLGVTS